MEDLVNDQHSGGLVRPDVSAADAEKIASECYGIEVRATELGSNQDRNYLLTDARGGRSVLRIDHPVFPEEAREAQHAAIAAYRDAGLSCPAVLPGTNGELTQRWHGFAVRRSEFADGEPMVDAGYLAPVVLAEFGALAAASVQALAKLSHPGLDRPNIWDMREAFDETLRLAPAITDGGLRARVLHAARNADAALQPIRERLPVQAIHGDLTDDNVVGAYGDDARVHPRTILDLGDLGNGWRVAELAVTASSMLHHEPARPLRVLETVAAFHRAARLDAAEARAVWPLIVLRSALLVASGWRQVAIDGDNAYARERIAGEQAIFDAATAVPLAVATEAVLARLGFAGRPAGEGLRLFALPEPLHPVAPLRSVIPSLDGSVEIIDAGVESAALAGGVWQEADAEARLVEDAFAGGAAAAVLPYGGYRLTRTVVDSVDAAATWPLDVEVWLPAGAEVAVCAPLLGTARTPNAHGAVIDLGEWLFEIEGVEPLIVSDSVVESGAPIGTLAASHAPRPLRFGLRRADAPLLPDAGAHRSEPGRARLIVPELVAAWRRFAPDPSPLLGLPESAQRDESDDEQARRERIFASAQERYYERPMQVERGWRHHLIDTTGRSYIDVVNNVTGLGHGHPAVADAVDRQIRLLNTNSRFLYRGLAEYSERLLELLPAGSGLDTVLLVNSGSEAVDLALRLAQAATGRRTIVALREAYHGWTMASDAVTTSAFDNPHALESRPDWVHVADVPNRYRGTYRGDATGPEYAAHLVRDLERLETDRRPVAGFICESVLGNAGGVLLPDGYLSAAYAGVRAAGGLCIADEVQVGFGRMGSTFWGFEQSGVIPDIITIAKPMGNGFPIGGVITSKRVADALASQGQFFSSAGGNPLSCQVGIAVLDAMAAEGLQGNAHDIGARLTAGFRELSKRHEMIGPVHGQGLYLGVELVRDRETMTPADAETAAICERLRELGVIVLPTSERSNVLKVKPPLCLTAESADFIVAQLDRVLSTGW